MRTYDLSPLFRSSIGFDRVSSLLDAAHRLDEASSNSGGYPPYNIEQFGEDAYGITIAVAGFAESDLDISLQDQTLTIRGKVGGFDTAAETQKPKLASVEGETKQPESKFIHRGIAMRAFERRFQLADHIKVGAANLENGLLSVQLVRELPEALKPRKISIGTGSGEHIGKVIENAA